MLDSEAWAVAARAMPPWSRLAAAPTWPRILVDCGLGIRTLERRLAIARLAMGRLDAVFITHELATIGCAHALALRQRIPVWMSHGTWSARGSQDYDGLLSIANHAAVIEVGTLQIHPFAVPHDAREPLQLTCTDGDRRLGVLTDLGHVPVNVLQSLDRVPPCCSNATTSLICWRRQPPPLPETPGRGRSRPPGPSAQAAAVLQSAAPRPVGPGGCCPLEPKEQPPRSGPQRTGRCPGLPIRRDRGGRCHRGHGLDQRLRPHRPTADPALR